MLPVVDLLVEHSGHKVKVTGGGPEYQARFSSLLSVFHYARAFWKFRKLAPKDMIVNLEWSSFHYRLKT